MKNAALRDPASHMLTRQQCCPSHRQVAEPAVSGTHAKASGILDNHFTPTYNQAVHYRRTRRQRTRDNRSNQGRSRSTHEITGPPELRNPVEPLTSCEQFLTGPMPVMPHSRSGSGCGLRSCRSFLGHAVNRRAEHGVPIDPRCKLGDGRRVHPVAVVTQEVGTELPGETARAGPVPALYAPGLR